MKILIASDLHGSSACIKKLMDRVDVEKPGQIVLLGDILYHGPRNDLPSMYDTKESARLLNEKANIITSIKGNCDSEVDKMMLDFNIEAPHLILSIDGLNILRLMVMYIIHHICQQYHHLIYCFMDIHTSLV